MAKMLGQSARYVTQQATKKLRAMLVVTLYVACALSLVNGLLMGISVHSEKFPPFLLLTVTLIVLLLLFGLGRWLTRKVARLDTERMNMRRGATGETVVAMTIADFPDDFYVINDITTRFGNLDHVVVGPTGVFVLDTKNWRGVISADGKGELLLNGRPTDKRFVNNFVVRIMSVKDAIRVLAPGLDPFFQGVFVFTSAWTNAAWGTTGRVHCLRDDQLSDYIVERKFGRKLEAHETKQIAQAFLGLAVMDTGFDSTMSIASPARIKTSRIMAASVQHAG